MSVESILNEIDAEIARLEQARQLLSNTTPVTIKRGPGRPRTSSLAASPKSKRRRALSAAARAKIAAAQKARWAKVRKTASKAEPAK